MPKEIKPPIAIETEKFIDELIEFINDPNNQYGFNDLPTRLVGVDDLEKFIGKFYSKN